MLSGTTHMKLNRSNQEAWKHSIQSPNSTPQVQHTDPSMTEQGHITAAPVHRAQYSWPGSLVLKQ